ncbi:WLM-domain-containing protein [Flagelloscypha sp. PMI_526]|nr:WLM-domain-containing protein [Flagelloscypha sp. PMI_526]
MAHYSTDKWVDTITHLKNQPKPEKALEMLQRVAVMVKPIMRKHGWRLPTLAEFFQKILLRLRPAHANDSFLEFGMFPFGPNLISFGLEHCVDDVVQLTHNKFYKFLSGLEEEYDALQRSGYSGEGFFTRGNRLGVNRRAQSTGGPKRLGGGLHAKDRSPRELAARAAERRFTDEKACGGGKLAEQEAKKADLDSTVTKVIDLTLEEGSDEDEVIIIKKPESSSSKPSSVPTPGPSRTKDKTKSRSQPYSRPPLAPAPIGFWECQICTLHNGESNLQCDACGSIKPPGPDGWSCFSCGQTGMPAEFWTCSTCGAVKLTS